MCIPPGMVDMPLIPALERLKQEDREFQVSLGYIVRLYLKKEYSSFCH
jgi:hypothetical protein